MRQAKQMGMASKNSTCDNAPMSDRARPFLEIGERVAWHRSTTGMDQLDYATKAGLKRSQLSNWETGGSRLSLDGALALRKAYGLSLDFLFAGVDDALPMTLRNAWRDRPSVKS